MKQSNDSQKIKAIFMIVFFVSGYLYLSTKDDANEAQIEQENKSAKLKKEQNNIDTAAGNSLPKMSENEEKNEEKKGNIVVEPAQEAMSSEATKSPEVILNDFKKLAELDFSPPKGVDFYNLGLEQVEGIASHDDNEGIAVIAAPFKASVDQAIRFIKDDRSDFKFLKPQDFTTTNDPKTLPTPVNSGISRITLISGNESGGRTSYAFIAERSDGRGTYLFILKTSDSFEKIKPQIDEVLSSLKIRK